MLSIYAALGKKTNACTWYRLWTPLRAMALNGDAAVFLEDFTPKITNQQIACASHHLYYARASRELIRQVYTFNRERHRRAPYTTPHVVYDSDDHIEHLNIWNPRFVSLGTRLPDGTKMSKGDKIEVDYPNETITLWEDGALYPNNERMDVVHNHTLLNLLKLMARAGSGVTTSSDYLSEVHRRYGCKNVYTFPNSLLEEDYPEIKVEREKAVTILWQGGHSHYEDWLTILEPLKRVFERRPRARFICWGQEFPAIRRAVPEKNYRYLPWLDYAKYTLRLATIGHHINLCPLVDTPFNLAKSAIKWTESSAITRPAATLAANVGPYQVIQHGETGMLYNNEKEFEDMLVDLIDDAVLRSRLGRRAHEFVWDNYNALQTAKPLAEWYRSMLL